MKLNASETFSITMDQRAIAAVQRMKLKVVARIRQLDIASIQKQKQQFHFQAASKGKESPRDRTS
jgi:hypothetical protein